MAKRVYFDELARIGRAITSPQRVELLDLLAQGPRTVEGLAVSAGLSVANTSQHLKVLRGARLVFAEKRGLYVVCHLEDGVAEFLVALRRFTEERSPELREARKEDQDVERIDRKTLLRRVREKAVVVVDVRPSEEYEAGHIAGAISLPLAELKKRLRDLPSGQDIVAYCRGPYCVLAVEAVRILRRRRRRAFRLEDGVPEWREAGLPIETGVGR